MNNETNELDTFGEAYPELITISAIDPSDLRDSLVFQED